MCIGGFCVGLTTSAEFLNLSKLHQLFVRFSLFKLLELCKTLYVAALNAGEVTTSTHLWNDASALYALGKAANHIRAAFVIVLCNLDVGCHMWA